MLAAFFGNVGAAFMPTQVQAALGQRTRTCVPHTPYTLVLKFVLSTGGVCGVATHAVSKDAGYSLLRAQSTLTDSLIQFHLLTILSILFLFLASHYYPSHPEHGSLNWLNGLFSLHQN